MRSRPATFVFGVSLALLVAFCCLANAQSGRRQAKPAPSVPVPTPTPEPSPTPTPKRTDSDLNILVATGDRGANFYSAPLTFYDAARDGCANELRERTGLTVDSAQREMTRGEAINKAKAGKTTYVVLVSLIADRMTSNNSDYPEFEVDYVVFAPGTAKVVASGRTYENSARKGPISVGRPTRSNLPSYRESLLRRAGEDAGERIAKSLHLSDPPPNKTSYMHRTSQEGGNAPAFATAGARLRLPPS